MASGGLVMGVTRISPSAPRLTRAAAGTASPKGVAVASVATGDSDYKEKMAAIYAAKTKPPWIKEPNAEKYSIEAVQARVKVKA